jgi:hypothetical protein
LSEARHGEERQHDAHEYFGHEASLREHSRLRRESLPLQNCRRLSSQMRKKRFRRESHRQTTLENYERFW